MLVLLDHSTPAPLRYALRGHVLLEAAESAGYEVFVTADKNIRYQQNLEGRKIAIVVPGNAQWPVLRRYVERVAAAVDAARMGSYVEVEIPFR